MGEGWTGIVLTGGSSRRMGRDKALLPIDGEAMAVRVAQALTAAGADRVVCVGGDLAALAALGLETVPDDNPGEGPLGGLITGLAAAAAELVVAAPCDLVAPTPASVRAVLGSLVAASDHVLAAVPRIGDVLQPLDAAYRRAALGPLAAAFGAGERSVKRAIHELPIVEVTGLDAAALADADTPDDLPP